MLKVSWKGYDIINEDSYDCPVDLATSNNCAHSPCFCGYVSVPAVHLNIWTRVFMWKKFGIDIRYYITVVPNCKQ